MAGYIGGCEPIITKLTFFGNLPKKGTGNREQGTGNR